MTPSQFLLRSSSTTTSSSSSLLSSIAQLFCYFTVLRLAPGRASIYTTTARSRIHLDHPRSDLARTQPRFQPQFLPFEFTEQALILGCYCNSYKITMVTSGDVYHEASLAVLPTSDHDHSRGRKRDRVSTRPDVKSVRPDESSTLRGRSRRRSPSPHSLVSRDTSPTVMSPTRRLLLRGRLRESRREHCPSRAASPSQQAFRRQQRTRSRSRGPRLEQELHRSLDLLSSLRNEVFLVEKATDDKEKS